jgi:hypothetical protein
MMATRIGSRLWHLLTARAAVQYERVLLREIVGSCDTLLDLGCGRASPAGKLLPHLRHSVGVDLHAPSLRASRHAGLHHEYAQGDVLASEEMFGARSFDCVTALDLIEHLSRTDGLKLLDTMERIARRKVILFTPNGWLSQPAYDGNTLQEHLSGWTVEDFRGRGYRVYGIHGWRALRGERARIQRRPEALWTLISLWSQPFTERRPGAAFQLLCVLDI